MKIFLFLYKKSHTACEEWRIMKKKIHVIPHTHWDREWYFTTSRSSVYLLNNLRDVIETLERDDRFHYFMLDAQGSLLDDYSKWMPQDIERIKKLVKAHRLIIGPWYTQSDQMVISGESIVRNLYYGIKTCEEYGGYMNVAYVPDSFGQAGNMPQIYQEFGIADTLFWRGVSNDMVKHTDYMWRGDDGSEVFATQIPFGYYIGGNIPEDQEESKQFWEEVCLRKAGTGATNQIYFPQGFDQCPIRHNLPDLIEQRNQADKENEYVISCMEDYIRDVKAQNPTLEVVSGELLNAKHMRIHRSIFSSRSDLKQLNTQVQNYVTNTMEPILALSSYLGNPYPKEAVKDVWKLLFENAAHDSVGSCISDSANEDVYLRYKKANDIAENLVELHERYIATASTLPPDACMRFTIFQTMAKKRSDIITKQLYMPEGEFVIKDEEGRIVPFVILEKEDMSDYVRTQTIRLNPSKPQYDPEKINRVKIAIDAQHLPSLGYTSYYLYPTANKNEILSSANVLENEIYHIEVADNGLLTIKDKRNDYVYQNQCEYLENGDDGDSFNYSPPRADMVISSKDTLVSSEFSGCDFYKCLTLHHEMHVPANLEQRAKGCCDAIMSIKTVIELKKDDPILYISASVDNQVLSHRLCVVFDADMNTQYNYADEQFGVIRRENEHSEDLRLYEECLKNAKHEKVVGPLNWVNTEDTWQEPSIAIEPTQSFVSLASDERGIALFPGGVREYEIIGEKKNKICLTLFRTYGFMGKENLLYRPGRASGEKIIATPNAQLLKTLELSFGFMSFPTCFNNAEVAQQARTYATPCDMYAYAEFLNGRLIFAQEERLKAYPKELEFMELKHQHLALSAFKQCEDKSGFIIRLYNPFYDRVVSEELQFFQPIKKAYICNLLEEEKEEVLKHDDHSIYLDSIGHCKFITLYVEV